MDSTVIFGNAYEYTNTHMHAITIDEERDHNMKETVEGGIAGFGWEK